MSISGGNQSGINGFYGAKNKRKWIGLERAIDDVVKRHHCQKIPKAFPNRLLGPPSKWKIFHRQHDAFNFSRSTSKDLHVFAFESKTFEKNTGQRLYLASSYPVFFHFYRQLESQERLHYEVIPEGAVCKLYFDLEYDKTCNPDCDGTEMMDIFIKYVCLSINAAFKLTCDREDILDLDASTPIKFSRHLIFQLKNACFKNNIHVGRFVVHIMSRLLEKVKTLSEADIHCTGSGDDETQSIKLNTITNDTDQHKSLIEDKKNGVDKTEANHIVNETGNVDHLVTEKLTEIDANTDQSKVWINDDKKTIDLDLYADVVEKFTVKEMKKLIVKNKRGEDVLFCDTGVYTKNRNFRLFLSSKLGKKNPLILSADNLYKQADIKLETVFYSSLVANVEYTSKLKILTYGDDDTDLNLTSHISGYREKSDKTGAESIAGYSKSPYPEVDEYITHTITCNGEKGVIRLWTYFHQGELLVYEIARYRYCHNIGRHHRSNNIMLIVDLQKGVFYQKCHDPDCYRQNYKSPEWCLPSNILPANYFTDDTEMEEENFEMDDEELLNSTLEIEKQLEQNSTHNAITNFSNESDDELLVAAVNHHDKSISMSNENG